MANRSDQLRFAGLSNIHDQVEMLGSGLFTKGLDHFLSKIHHIDLIDLEF